MIKKSLKNDNDNTHYIVWSRPIAVNKYVEFSSIGQGLGIYGMQGHFNLGVVILMLSNFPRAAIFLPIFNIVLLQRILYQVLILKCICIPVLFNTDVYRISYERKCISWRFEHDRSF